MKTGAVIVAAGTSSYMTDFKPMLKMGRTTLIKRIISTLKQAGVDPILVVTGSNANQLEKHISHMGVICLRNERYTETQMFDSARIGLEYLHDKCDRILFTPSDIPLFSVQSVYKLLNTSAEISCPTHKGVQGHPLLISSDIVPLLLTYTGEGGIRGAIRHSGKKITKVPVEDDGILMGIDTLEDYEKLLYQYREMHKAQALYFQLQLRLCKEEPFFGPGVAEFLNLVEQTGSMQTACSCMHMSYSKAWNMVNMVEEQLGFSILVRRAGGPEGGSSQLTEEGKEFTQRFTDFQNELKSAADKLFNKYFPPTEE